MLKLLLIIVVLSICSCGSINQQFINSVDSYTKTILPEYKEYVKNDPSLDTTTQRIRIQTANTFQALVDSAKSSVADKEKPVAPIADDKNVESEKPVENKEKVVGDIAKVDNEKSVENKEKPVIDDKKVENEKSVEDKEKPIVDDKKAENEKPVEDKEKTVGDIAKVENVTPVVDSVKSIDKDKNNE